MGGFGDHDDVVLEAPADGDLGGGFLVLLGDFNKFGDVVDFALHEGGPGFEDDAILFAEIQGAVAGGRRGAIRPG